ncbi:hypothetical protein FKW77_001498 [Venturia effusa]|uniref:Uncharacterized protein n=1 Tax=Venturia effusa TaxID=50376 RepID=A0A517LBW0_9PEZI|nr:hypothetical protein FKW77_001498 [Venturia effusa]
MMSDDALVDILISLKMEDSDSDEDGITIENEDEVGIVGDDKSADIMQILRSINMTMRTMDKKMSKLELEVSILKRKSLEPRHRDAFGMPDPDMHGHTTSPVFRFRSSETSATRDDDTESFTDVKGGRRSCSERGRCRSHHHL